MTKKSICFTICLLLLLTGNAWSQSATDENCDIEIRSVLAAYSEALDQFIKFDQASVLGMKALVKIAGSSAILSSNHKNKFNELVVAHEAIWDAHEKLKIMETAIFRKCDVF